METVAHSSSLIEYCRATGLILLPLCAVCPNNIVQLGHKFCFRYVTGTSLGAYVHESAHAKISLRLQRRHARRASVMQPKDMKEPKIDTLVIEMGKSSGRFTCAPSSATPCATSASGAWRDRVHVPIHSPKAEEIDSRLRCASCADVISTRVGIFGMDFHVVEGAPSARGGGRRRALASRTDGVLFKTTVLFW
ncbi:hypothetical protein C8J57DRAFT_1723235 [Mycena rebaudengoi]|nr:hypothetical protein C8J57DRAFT_1723235 [Mycena rebaudengoi]